MEQKTVGSGKIKYLVLISTLSLIIISGAGKTVFHCKPEPEFCGLEVEKIDDLEKELEEESSINDKLDRIYNISSRAAKTENETKLERLEKLKGELTKEISKQRRKKKEYKRLDRFYSAYIKAQKISYSNETVPENLAKTELLYPNHFYPIQKFDRNKLEIKDGCYETRVLSFDTVGFYGVYWHQIEEPWYCQTQLYGEKTANLHKSPLKYLEIASANLITKIMKNTLKEPRGMPK